MSENTQKKTAPSTSTAIDVEQPSVKNNTIIIPQKNQDSDDLQTISMDELFDNVYPPRACIVENLLYVGTYLFVGSPKVGKSFFMAQLGYSVGSGTNLWGYKVNPGGALYLALEDNYSRLQQRLSTMYGTETTSNFHMATLAKKLNEGLNKQLENHMKKHPNTKLIIIDTLKKIRLLLLHPTHFLKKLEFYLPQKTHLGVVQQVIYCPCLTRLICSQIPLLVSSM